MKINFKVRYGAAAFTIAVAAGLPAFSASGLAVHSSATFEASAAATLPAFTSQAQAEIAATTPVRALDLTTAAGLYQDEAGKIPVTAYGQNVRRIKTDAFSATWVSGDATWKAEGLAVGNGARWDLDDVLTVAGMVTACTPSAGDTSPNHGIIGSAGEYVTVSNSRYRWRTSADSAAWTVPAATFPMQVASFGIEGSALRLWANGIAAGTQSGKGPLTAIDRLFHRSSTVTYEGTLAYLALSASPFPDTERQSLQAAASKAAARSWPLDGRAVFTPAGVPLITEILGTDQPDKPILVSHHGLGAKSDGDVYNVSNFVKAFALQAFSPWFDNRFTSSDYQKGAQSWLEAPMIEAFRAHLGQPSKPVLIYGHSAGGQWVSRVAAYNPPQNVQRFVPANPSTWVFPDGRNYPHGFGHVPAGPERDKAIAAYLRLPLTVYVGELDNNPDDADLDTSAEAMLQGKHRFERAENVFRAAQSAAARLEVALNWRFVVAAGIGHAGTAMLNSPARKDAFFPA